MSKVLNPPLESDVLDLPRWARIALAARCAQRVQPLLVSWLKSNREFGSDDLDAIERAVAAGLDSARRGAAYPAAGLSEYVQSVAHNCFAHAEGGGSTQNESAAAAGYAAQAAAFVVKAVAHSYDDDVLADVSTVTAAIDDASSAVEELADVSVAREAANAVWADFDLLRSLAIEQLWTDYSNVDPDVLGPLWPQGKPKRWPEDSSADNQPAGLSLTIEVPDDWSDEQIAAKVKEVADKIDSAFRQLGGRDGLRLLPPTDVTVPSVVLAGVGS